MTVLILAAAILGLGQAPTPADDFAFRLEYGVCTTDVLDTFQGTFVRDLGGPVPPLSIPLTLPQPSRDMALQAVLDARFFDYPSEFRTTPPSCTVKTNAIGGSWAECPGVSAFAPSNHYKLTVRNAGVTHTVSWQDGIRPSTEQADRLRQMLQTIIEMVRALPELQRLPGAQVGCA